jgi:hypothetical protein
METENTWQYQGGVWLMRQSKANPSRGEIPCYQGKELGIFKNQCAVCQWAYNSMQRNQQVMRAIPYFG